MSSRKRASICVGQLSIADYSITPVTSGAWVQLSASLPANVHEMEIFDSSGVQLEIGYGPSGSETRAFVIVPGGNGRINQRLDKGMRVAIRAISTTANTASSGLLINLYN